MGEADCQHCGKNCGNAGAKTQHEKACPYNPENMPESGGQNVPATQPQTTGQSSAGMVPADGNRTGGADLVDSIVRLTDPEAPTQARAQGAKGVFGFVVNGLERYQEYRETRMEQADARAQSVDLQPADRYPECIECGHQFDGEDIGLMNEQVKCPGCGKVYDVIDAPVEEVPAEPTE